MQMVFRIFRQPLAYTIFHRELSGKDIPRKVHVGGESTLDIGLIQFVLTVLQNKSKKEIAHSYHLLRCTRNKPQDDGVLFRKYRHNTMCRKVFCLCSPSGFLLFNRFAIKIRLVSRPNSKNLFLITLVSRLHLYSVIHISLLQQINFVCVSNSIWKCSIICNFSFFCQLALCFFELPLIGKTPPPRRSFCPYEWH